MNTETYLTYEFQWSIPSPVLEIAYVSVFLYKSLFQASPFKHYSLRALSSTSQPVLCADSKDNFGKLGFKIVS